MEMYFLMYSNIEYQNIVVLIAMMTLDMLKSGDAVVDGVETMIKNQKVKQN